VTKSSIDIHPIDAGELSLKVLKLLDALDHIELQLDELYESECPYDTYSVFFDLSEIDWRELLAQVAELLRDAK
jgi:hypothetical protein